MGPDMYICVCKAITEKRIQRAVNDGVVSLRELSLQTGLGSCCGKCVPDARRALGQALMSNDGARRLMFERQAISVTA